MTSAQSLSTPFETQIRDISSGVGGGYCGSFGDRGLMQGGSTRSLCRAAVTHSGRLVLRDQRHRKIWHPSCSINLIPVIARIARKPVWSDITVTTASGFLAASLSASVEAPPTQDNQVLNKGGWPQHLDTAQGLPSFGSNGTHRHKTTPLNPDRYSTCFARTREVKGF
jgi:hypothetical protein